MTLTVVKCEVCKQTISECHGVQRQYVITVHFREQHKGIYDEIMKKSKELRELKDKYGYFGYED